MLHANMRPIKIGYSLFLLLTFLLSSSAEAAMTAVAALPVAALWSAESILLVEQIVEISNGPKVIIFMSPVEDIIVCLESFGRPEIAARIQREKLEIAGFRDCSVRGAAQLNTDLNWLVDL